jgi:hypothetical protein
MKTKHSAPSVGLSRKPAEWLRISKFCVAKGCKRRGITANRLSDFWVVLCEQHQNTQITLDIDKIPEEQPCKLTSRRKK